MPRGDQVVAVQQFAGAGVPRDVHHRVALVHHADPIAAQPVDHPIDRVLIARDQRRRQQHHVPRSGGDHRVLVVGDTGQGAERLPLGAGGDDQHLIVGIILDLLQIDQGVLGDLQEAQLASDCHVAQHGAPDIDDLAAVFDGQVHDLLDAVHVGGEAGHDQFLLSAGEDPLQGGFDVAFVGGETRHIGIGRIDHEQIDAFLP